MHHTRALISVLSIGVGFAMATVAYYFSFAAPMMDLLCRWTAKSMALPLNLIGMDVSVEGVLVISDRLSFAIVPECTAIGPLLIFLGGVIGYPSAPLVKIKGALLGIVLLTTLNHIRVISLFVIGIYSRQHLEVMHLLVWQSLLILAAVGLWLLWIRRYVRTAQA